METDADGTAGDVSGKAYTVERFAESTSGNARTAETYRRLLGRLQARIGGPLAAASDRDILALKRELKKMDSGAWTLNVLRMFYRAAYRNTGDARYAKIVEDLHVKQRGKRLAPTDILTIADVNAMIRAAKSVRDRALIVALWETGARIHEVLAVKIGNVRTWDLPAGKPGFEIFFRKVKVEGEEHAGYVTEGGGFLQEWLNVHPTPNPDAPLFVSWRRNALSYTGAFSVIRSTAARAKITKRVHPHLFRHSRATYLLQRGMPEAQVKKLLGWTAGSPMLSRYAHLNTKDARDALLKVNGYAVPEESAPEPLVSPVDDLRPVLPMMPGVPQVSVAEKARMALEDRELAAAMLKRILEDPVIVGRIREIGGTVPTSAPAKVESAP